MTPNDEKRMDEAVVLIKQAYEAVAPLRNRHIISTGITMALSGAIFLALAVNSVIAMLIVSDEVAYILAVAAAGLFVGGFKLIRSSYKMATIVQNATHVLCIAREAGIKSDV